MRGFVLSLETGAQASAASARAMARLARWRNALAPGAVRTVSSGPFDCTVYTECATPADYNQVLTEEPDLVMLHAGPKLLWCDRARLPRVSSDDLEMLAGRADLVARGMETNVLCAYRPQAGAVVIKTDLLNSTFIYMARIDGLMLWSTSSLLLARALASPLHPTSMAEFLIEGNIYAQRSMYRDVRLMEPSTLYRFDRAGAEQSLRYWRVDLLPLESIGVQEARDVLISELDREFEAMRASGRTMVFDLTGGYDSRLNVGFALRKRLAFRTIVAGDAQSDDVRVAARVADRFELDHRCISPPAGELDEWQGAIDAALACTDGEYDAIEYAHIYNVHRRHYGEDEVSVHGSTADLTRHYYFYPLAPYGHFPLEKMIEKKFTPLVDGRTFLHPDLALDWVQHMLARIAEVDHPALPAFARLNNIYLRLRMQFWQGRIASSTNRVHASFTPWTSIPILEAILTTRWREMENRRLTRRLVHEVYPGLDRIPMAGGSIAGVGPVAALRALPGACDFYGRKVLERLRRLHPRPPAPPRLRGLREFVAREIEELADLLHPRVLSAVSREAAVPTLPDAVLGKLYTLIRVRKTSRDWGA